VCICILFLNISGSFTAGERIMTANDVVLQDQLSSAHSQEEGLHLLRQHSADLSDALADVLHQRQVQLAAADDPDGAKEYAAWAQETRSLVTRQRILATDPRSVDEARALLTGLRDRFDDAFIGLSARIAGADIGDLKQALARLEQGDDTARPAAEAAARTAQTEVAFLAIVADMSGVPAHLAQAGLTRGTFLLLQAQLAAKLGTSDTATSEQARQALAAVAADEAAPPALRASAEGNLAVLAGPDRPDEVERHQTAAQRLAEAANDRHVLRTTRRDRAYWARQRQDWPRAYDLYRANVEDTERELWGVESPIAASELVAATIPDYAASVEVCLERARDDPAYYERALEYVDIGKARAFLRTLATLDWSRGPAPERLLQRRAAILRALQQLGTTLPLWPSSVQEQRLPQVRDLLRALGLTEEQLNHHTATLALDLQCRPCTFAQMRELVSPNGAILSLFALPDRLLLFLLTEAGLHTPPTEVGLTREDQARVAVNMNLTLRLRADFGDWNEIQRQLDTRIEEVWPTHNLHFLYQRLIAPLVEQLAGLSSLTIVGHGPLRDLPFHALLRPDGGALVDDLAVAYTPSLAVLRHCTRRQAQPLRTCFAAGVSPEHGGPTGAAAEAAVVAAHFGAQSQPATRAAVLGQAGATDVIHLACHSDFSSALTSFNGLKLEDGVITQGELAAINCQAGLVTLSACQTAGEDVLPGEEMAGLVGAFMRAGSPSVVASLWPVSDRVALPMMDAFYTALRQPGVSKAAALRAAQLAVKHDRRFDHPYFWAPFYLWGDPRG